jgi:hypothetical protein
MTLDSAFTRVPEEAGAIRTLAGDGSWIDNRDALDSAIVADVRDGTGNIVGWNGEPRSEGMCYRAPNFDETYPDVWASCEYQWRNLYELEDGYPELDEGTAPDDTDLDGMPDVWEIDHCMDEETANDDQDMDADGYHDLEEFLNGTVPFDRDGDNDNDGITTTKSIAATSWSRTRATRWTTIPRRTASATPATATAMGAGPAQLRGGEPADSWAGDRNR